MAGQDGSTVYLKISDDYDAEICRGAAPRWPKLHLAAGLAVSIIGCGAAFAGFKASTGKASAVDLLVDGTEFTFGVLHNFTGSTPEFMVEPGGLLSADIKAVPSLHHTYFLLDHRIQYVVDGEIHITDGTGQKMIGKAGDLFYMAKGSNVTCHAPGSAHVYTAYVDKTSPISASTPSAYEEWMYDSARTTAISHFPDLKNRGNARYQEYKSTLPTGTTTASFDEAGCFKFSAGQSSGSPIHWNFCSGIFDLSSGPAFTSGEYAHHYEIDFLLDGKMDLNYEAAGEAQSATLLTGDLMHNPREMNLHIDTPTTVKFLTVSLSNVDDFYR